MREATIKRIIDIFWIGAIALIILGLALNGSEVIYPKKYQKLIRCTCKLEHLSPDGRVWGSGTLTKHGILSVYHLVEGRVRGKLIASFQDGTTIVTREVHLAWFDPSADLALFTLDSPLPKGWGHIKLAKKSKIGEKIAFAGFNSAALARLRFDFMEEYIKYGTMIHPVWFGDSGGGVFNANNRLIGIIKVLIFNEFYGYPVATLCGYATSLDKIHRFMDEYQHWLDVRNNVK